MNSEDGLDRIIGVDGYVLRDYIKNKALVMMLADTMIDGKIDSVIFNRYSFEDWDEYNNELKKYEDKVKQDLIDCGFEMLNITKL